uniref:Uncharacterized protein n=1 Tax=Romanomermis culicivorax TaxID=13658 RepID=A0A915JII2_ROMCU
MEWSWQKGENRKIKERRKQERSQIETLRAKNFQLNNIGKWISQADFSGLKELKIDLTGALPKSPSGENMKM